MPIIGARYGFGTTEKVYKDVLKEHSSGTKDGIYLTDKTSLSVKERTMLKTLVEDGTIDTTQMHDLAGMGSDSGMNPLSSESQKFMKIASWFFHAAEHINRESTALMVYRLAKMS